MHHRFLFAPSTCRQSALYRRSTVGSINSSATPSFVEQRFEPHASLGYVTVGQQVKRDDGVSAPCSC